MGTKHHGGPASLYPRESLFAVEVETHTGEVIDLTCSAYEVCSICDGRGKVASEIARDLLTQCAWCSGCGGWWVA